MDRTGLRIGGGAAALVLLCLVPVGLDACGGDGANTSSDAGGTSVAGAPLRVEVAPLRAAPGDTVQARVVNDTDKQFTYGAGYELERQMGGEFVQVKLPDRPVIEIGYVAKPGGTGPPVEVVIPKNALPGQYRVVIQRDVPDVGDLSGEFEVSGEY